MGPVAWQRWALGPGVRIVVFLFRFSTTRRVMLGIGDVGMAVEVRVFGVGSERQASEPAGSPRPGRDMSRQSC